MLTVCRRSRDIGRGEVAGAGAQVGFSLEKVLGVVVVVLVEEEGEGDAVVVAAAAEAVELEAKEVHKGRTGYEREKNGGAGV